MYQFKEEDAYEFARSVGIEAKPKGRQLIFKHCPYCKSNKDRGTFAISLDTGMFNCMRSTCGVKGNMVTLSQDFDTYRLPIEYEEYYRPKKKYVELKQPEKKIEPKPKAIEYLESRGISKAIADHYEITTQTNKDNVLVFPFYDEKGILQFVKYRKTDFDKEKDKCKEWCQANCKPILFGMKQCSGNFKSLVITEGQMDSLSVSEAYGGMIDVVSVPTGAKGFTFIPYCYDWLSKYEEIIIFGDNEKGHITLYDDFLRRFPNKVKHVREEDYKDCKDANEILLKYGKDQVKKCINNAEFPPVSNVICMSDVEEVEVEKFYTGFSELDSLLGGGLPFGYLTILTGVRGEGKSTLGQQIIAYALDQDLNSFIYSGELTNSNAKEWIDRQLAGQEVCEECLSNGYTKYFIRKSTKKQIESWYRDRLFLYDNRLNNSDEEDNLIKVITEAIVRYDIKVLLIDNLMTGIDKFNGRDDKIEKQSKFAKALSRIAQQYNVAIILVAHKRKHGANLVSGANENDEVSGSADITNLAGIVLAYGENTDEETKNYAPSRLKVLKNRLDGKKNYKGFLMLYNERSKRVYGEHDRLDYVFGWKRDKEGFYYSENDEETPFY